MIELQTFSWRLVFRFLWDQQEELTERAEQYKIKNGQDELEGSLGYLLWEL